MEPKTAQLRVKPGPSGAMQITAYGTSGTIFWETPTRARFLIDSGGFELVNMQQVGAVERKPVGPKETKPTAPAESKSSSVDPAGPSTDSAKSSEPGTAASESASPPAQVSPQNNADTSAKRKPGRPKVSASSQ